MGFPTEAIEAQKFLMYDKNVPYTDFVRKIKTNQIASTVKLADLRHNSGLSQLDMVDNSVLKRVEKYRLARAIPERAES